MNSVKMVLVKDEGVLGFITEETSQGAWICWFIDGLRYESFLVEDEYVIKFTGEIDG